MKNFHLAIYGRKKKQNGPKEGRSYFALLNKSYSMKDLKIQYWWKSENMSIFTAG